MIGYAYLDLHSNMDRLKRGLILIIYTTKCNLHSNMDRLKHARIDRERKERDIYIPIWID